MNFIKGNIVGLVAIVIAIAGFYFPVSSAIQHFGGVTNYDEVDTTALKVGGTNGSRIGPIISTTCNLVGTDVTQTGTSTVAYDCAVTGVVSGDVVFAQLSTSTVASNKAWSIVSATASSTSGFVTVLLQNLGQSAVPSVTRVGSSTEIVVLHPVTSVPGL